MAQPTHTETCPELKQIECGFGQVLKQKTKPDGCPEFTCGEKTLSIRQRTFNIIVSCGDSGLVGPKFSSVGRPAVPMMWELTGA